MKHIKTAAAVAGSVMALGAASPAVAAEAPSGQPPTSPSLSLNQGLFDAMNADSLDVAPIDGPIADGVADTLKTKELLRSVGDAPRMLGGLPLG